MGRVVKLRGDLKERIGGDVPYDAIFVKAVAQALREHPYMNATLEGDEIRLFEDVNIGVAMDVGEGLIVPVVKGADKKSLEDLVAEVSRLAGKARDGSLSMEEVTGGTFTITNLGMYRVEAFTPLVNPGETAILGIGRIGEEVTAIEGEISTRLTATLSLTFDHRIVDGAQAARFLKRLCEILEEIEG